MRTFLLLPFAFRFAWRQLIKEKSKLLAAILGVMFASVLVFMQIGFRDSLDESVKKIPDKLTGDLFLISSQSEALWRTVPFRKSDLIRALGIPGVIDVKSIYIGMAKFKNPQTKTSRTIMVFGFEPQGNAINFNLEMSDIKKLSTLDTIAFDEYSRPEFGEINVSAPQKKSFVEINKSEFVVSSKFRLGASFSSEGNIITNINNFLKIFHFREPNQIDIGSIYLRSNADLEKSKTAIQSILGNDVRLLTKNEMIDFEISYWRNSAPLGFIFEMGAVMSLIIGMVIVYQILFTDIINNITQYATLIAIGYSRMYLKLVVLSSAFILSVIGFIPGCITSLVLYRLAESITFIHMPTSAQKILSLYIMVFLMCVVSGLFAIRKIKLASPADMF